MGNSTNSDPAREEVIAALLDWHEAMGVDTIVGEVPVDRFAERRERPRPPVAADSPLRAASAQPAAAQVVSDPTPPRSTSPASQATRTDAHPATRNTSEPVIATDQTLRDARSIASACSTLDELRAALDRFEGCNLRLTARGLVFADGTPGSRVMFIGEAPGREEDIQGLPFVGPSGRLLDRMLAAIGLSRQSAYIANVVPWRPPGNRTPTPQETAVCKPFLERQIELAAPDFLVCLGGAAAKEILQTSEGILKLRGQWRSFTVAGRTIPAMATLHPAYLLRQPLQKRLAWRDFLALQQALAGQPV